MQRAEPFCDDEKWKKNKGGGLLQALARAPRVCAPSMASSRRTRTRLQRDKRRPDEADYRCGADATSAPEMVACNHVAIGTRSHSDAAELFRSPGPQPVYTSPELVRVAILVGGKRCVWRRSPRNPH